MLAYIVDAPPPFATPMAVADGVSWVRLAIPYSVNHVNVYLIQDGDGGWTAVDTGVDDAATRQAWTNLLSDLGGLAALRRIFLTHHHPDHALAAGWLQQLTGAEVWMSPEERAALDVSLQPDPVDTPDRFEAHLIRMGCSADEAGALRLRSSPAQTGEGLAPAAWRPTQAGAALSADWRVIGAAGGHSPEPLSLVSADRRLFVAGDQLLPAISPYVGVRLRDPDASPVRDYLAYLDLIAAAVDDDTLVLPGHGVPFRGAPVRIDGARKRHRRRCDLLADACREAPRTARELVDVAFGARGLDMLPLTIADTLSHLNLLRAERRLDACERDGVLYWRPAGPDLR